MLFTSIGSTWVTLSVRNRRMAPLICETAAVFSDADDGKCQRCTSCGSTSPACAAWSCVCVEVASTGWYTGTSGRPLTPPWELTSRTTASTSPFTSPDCTAVLPNAAWAVALLVAYGKPIVIVLAPTPG